MHRFFFLISLVRKVNHNIVWKYAYFHFNILKGVFKNDEHS